MRRPDEIRKQVLRLRDKRKLTMTTICERARISRHDIISCLAMCASEDTLRKLDAFLDAPKLHERDRSQSPLAYDMESLSREVWREFRMKTPHPAVFDRMSPDRQRQTYLTIVWRAKFWLQKKVLAEHGIIVKVPDGATYWQYKARCLHRIRGEEALRTGDRDSRRVPWARPIREERPL